MQIFFLPLKSPSKKSNFLKDWLRPAKYSMCQNYENDVSELV